MGRQLLDFARQFDHPKWMTDGACRDMNPDLWFPSRGEDWSTPKAICATCRVRLLCKEYAIEHRERGVWGGTSEKERRDIRRQRAQRRAA